MLATELTPLQLFKRAQSSRISVSKRLRALSMMARDLDHPTTDGAAPDVANRRQVAELEPPQVAELLNAASKLVHSQLLPRLQRYRLRLADLDELTEAQRQWLHRYFEQHIYPLLTPLAVDPGRPFPRLAPGRLYLLVVLQTDGKLGGEREIYGLVKMSNRMPRLVRARGEESAGAPPRRPRRAVCCLLWREDVIRYFIGALFSGMQIKGVYQFRFVCAPQAPGDELPTTVRRPRTICAPITRIDVEAGTPPHLVQWLVDHLHTSTERVLYCDSPLGMADLGELADYLITPVPREEATGAAAPAIH